MKPYEEIKFPNGHLRWIREGKEYVCRMTEEYMEKIKNQHEQKPEWQGLTHEEVPTQYKGDSVFIEGWLWAEAKLKEKNNG